jgi:hypothetical protein
VSVLVKIIGSTSTGFILVVLENKKIRVARIAIDKYIAKKIINNGLFISQR